MRNDDINHPKHYAGYPASIECIDITRHLNFQLGNAVKYIWRAGKKGGLEKGIEDLKKAEWYLEDRRNAPGPGKIGAGRKMRFLPVMLLTMAGILLPAAALSD